MAEGRMLKKKISLDVRVADLKSDTHRLLFTLGIAHLDVDGRISGDPREFKATVVPMLDHITREAVSAFFHDAERLGLIWRYQAEDRWVVQYPGFKKNQNLRPDKEAKSQYPPPPDDFSPGDHAAGSGELPEYSGSSPEVLPTHSGLNPDQNDLPIGDAIRRNHTKGSGQEESEAGDGHKVVPSPKGNNSQHIDIENNLNSQGMVIPLYSRTAPGVVREDSGRTPAEVKLSEGKGREVNKQASACVVEPAAPADDDSPPSDFSPDNSSAGIKQGAASSRTRFGPSRLVELWNDLGCRPLVSELTDDRRKKIGLRLRKRGDPDWWRRLFKKVKTLNKPWLNFDFLMRNDTNCLKVLEGNYDHDFNNRGNGNQTRVSAGRASVTESNLQNAQLVIERWKRQGKVPDG